MQANNPISAGLLDSEVVLWTGQPNKAHYIKDETRSTSIAFSFFFIAFSILYFLTNERVWMFLLFAASSAVSGLIFVTAIPHGRGYEKHHFAVTDKRLIQSYPGESTIEYIIIEYSDLCDVKLQEDAEGTGTIVCSSKASFVVDHLRFKFVENACDIYQLILSLQQKHREMA